MKRTRPTHRRVRDAATPSICLTGHFLNRSVEFSFRSIGKSDTTKVTLSWWQIRDMLAELRRLNEYAACQLEQEASLVRTTIQPKDQQP